jgi:ferric-dicitrate binding protein FerR (iron transport regulator)
MAAAVLVLLAAAVWLLKGAPIGRGGKTALLAERTGANEMKTILLPDSSVVVLNANSSLEYSADLMVAGNREVRLEGNGFFSVKKDAGFRKFVVHARTLSVTVLGTELNVDARSTAAEVALVSGRVKVAIDGDGNPPVYLLPGNKVILDTLKKTLIPAVVNTLLYSAWTDGKWNFRHTSLEEIGGLIGEYYGTEVTFKNKRSKRLCINAVIAVGSLQKLIPVLEQTLHIQMTLSENRLIIE